MVKIIMKADVTQLFELRVIPPGVIAIRDRDGLAFLRTHEGCVCLNGPTPFHHSEAIHWKDEPVYRLLRVGEQIVIDHE